MAKKVIIIEDTECKHEIDAFLKEQAKDVLHVFEPNGIYESFERSLKQFNDLLKSDRRILINTAESITFVAAKDIVHCKSNRNYTEIFFRDTSRIVSSKTLREFELLLTPYHFVRIHKSHLINAAYLHKFVKAEGGYVLLSDNTRLPVAVRKKEQLLQAMKTLQREGIPGNHHA